MNHRERQKKKVGGGRENKNETTNKNKKIHFSKMDFYCTSNKIVTESVY